MLAWIKRITLALSLLSLILGFALVYSYHDDNPTGRLYSSSVVLDANQAESVLSLDLGVERNDEGDNTQCICSQDGLSHARCNACFVSIGKQSAIPDFVTDTFIADSKFYPNSSFGLSSPQIQAFIQASEILEVPLWIFVHVDTSVSDNTYQRIALTGGGVVHYFTDNLFDAMASDVGWIMLILGGLLFGGFVALRVRQTLRQWDLPEPEDPPRHEKIVQPRDLPQDRAKKSMDEAEEFGKRLRGKIRIEIEDDEPDEER
jgi:hypothetical protein